MTDTAELVARLRATSVFSLADRPRNVAHEAANLIEALTTRAEAAEAEVENWKGKAKVNEDALLQHSEICVGHWRKISALEAEVERLKDLMAALLEQVSLSDTWPKFSDAYAAADAALAGQNDSAALRGDGE